MARPVVVGGVVEEVLDIKVLAIPVGFRANVMESVRAI